MSDVPARSPVAAADRTYLISGAGGGIGGATVVRLLRTSANVVGLDLSSRRLEQIAMQAKELPGDFRTLKVNLTTESGAEAAVAFALSGETLRVAAGVR